MENAVIFDIDGTLASHENIRSPYDLSKVYLDKPIIPVVDSLKVFHQAGYKIIILSGREDKSRMQTARWFKMHEIPYDHMYMRATADRRRDSIIKTELYNEHIKDKYNVIGVFDDRLQVIREAWTVLGVFVFNCNQTLAEY